MSPIDYEILHFFEQYRDIQASPKVIGANIDYDRNYTGKRCRNFADHDLLERAGDGLYQLSERGEKFLDGELPASELEPDETDV
ncbi:MarR family transcriptional regulator [Haloterrigena gelatinilytica]|nr:MarR family transcriptional regulator [Haloterrigena gelatinilytica]